MFVASVLSSSSILSSSILSSSILSSAYSVITSAVVTSSLPLTLLMLSAVDAGRGVVLEAVESLGLVVVVLEEGELVEADSGELGVVLIAASFSSETD